MHNITVHKNELISKLIENRDQHKEEYDAAIVLYKKQFVAESAKYAQEVAAAAEQDGVQFPVFKYLPLPEEHTDDYNRVIALMEWEVDSQVELSESDFRQYVLNDWSWSHSFAANTRSYLA